MEGGIESTSLSEMGGGARGATAIVLFLRVREIAKGEKEKAHTKKRDK